MGGSSAGSGGGGGGGSPNQMVKNKQKEKFKTTDKFGYPIKKNTIQKIADKSPVLNLIKNNPFSKKTEQVNREYYDTKVKNYSGNTKGTYEDYIRSRGRGEVDAMGRTISNDGGNNNNQAVETPLKAGIFPMPKIDGGEKAIILPTTSEDTIEKRKKKTKATGRSKSIMTSAKGVTKTSSDYSLGKPSLLGQV